MLLPRVFYSIVAGCLFLSNISVLANPVAAHARDVAVYLETTPDIANETSIIEKRVYEKNGCLCDIDAATNTSLLKIMIRLLRVNGSKLVTVEKGFQKCRQVVFYASGAIALCNDNRNSKVTLSLNTIANVASEILAACGEGKDREMSGQKFKGTWNVLTKTDSCRDAEWKNLHPGYSCIL